MAVVSRRDSQVKKSRCVGGISYCIKNRRMGGFFAGFSLWLSWGDLAPSWWSSLSREAPVFFSSSSQVFSSPFRCMAVRQTTARSRLSSSTYAVHERGLLAQRIGPQQDASATSAPSVWPDVESASLI